MNIGYNQQSEKSSVLPLLGANKEHSAYSFSKRLIDIVLSLIALVLLAPLMLLTALLIAIESSGPVFFKQIRVGIKGQPFTMWKFRSMRQCNDKQRAKFLKKEKLSDGVRFKMKNDPRITHVGKIIRKLSIDELPQLINVLKGDMSLVGPRPALPEEVNKYTAWQYLRLNAKPGITCIWQVSGRSDIPFLKQVEMDLDYIRNASLALDLTLLVKTIPAVLLAKGAH